MRLFYLSHHNFSSSLSFNVYILDYLKKRGYHKAASHLVTEAHIPPGTKPPINAPQGLLFELVSSFLPFLSLQFALHRWWTVFWVIFTARNSGIGLEEARIYNKVRSLRPFLIPFPPYLFTPFFS